MKGSILRLARQALLLEKPKVSDEPSKKEDLYSINTKGPIIIPPNLPPSTLPLDWEIRTTERRRSPSYYEDFSSINTKAPIIIPPNLPPSTLPWGWELRTTERRHLPSYWEACSPPEPFALSCTEKALSFLPKKWKVRRSPHNGKFYLSHVLEITQWERPVMCVGSPALGCEGMIQYVHLATETTTIVRPIEGVEETTRLLPAGWERRRTWKGELYYVDHNRMQLHRNIRVGEPF